MAHINQLKAILKETTAKTITIGRIKDAPIGVYISPSNYTNTMHLEEVYFYDVILKEESLDLFELAQNLFLRCKTNVDFNYNDFDARGYISVDNGLEFTVMDDIEGTTSGATGTVYRIVDDILYLKDVVGVWQTAEVVIGYISSTASTLMDEIFPFYIDVTKVREDYDVDGDFKEYWSWYRFECRWTL